MHPSPAHKRLSFIDGLFIVLILAWGLWRLAPDLAHDSIWNWDESFHQLVTRSVYENPFYPRLIDDPEHPLKNLREWWNFRVWMHKPTGPFWFGALMMHIVGKQPLALRLGSLLGELVGAMTVYLLASRLSSRPAGFCAALGFLALPLGWTLVQGRYVGDVTDLTLTGCLCVSMLALFRSIERDSWRWAALAGAATGLGYLCKTFLALTPIGVAASLWALRAFGFCEGPRLRHTFAMLGIAVLVAAPWNLYCLMKWPNEYIRTFHNTLGFTSAKFGEDVGPVREQPADVIFSNLNPVNYSLPAVLILLFGVWLIIRSIRSRHHVETGLSLWLWATWIGHSFMSVKGLAHLWNSVVPGFVGVALLLSDTWNNRPLARPLALATLAGCATPKLIPVLPLLTRLREMVPASVFPDTHRVPGLVEGLVCVLPALAGGAILSLRPLRRFVPASLLAFPAVGWLLYLTLIDATRAQLRRREEAQAHFVDVHTKEVGRALEAITPRKTAIFFTYDLDTSEQFEDRNLAFWSNRLVIRTRDTLDYGKLSYHLYLVSPVAEPFKPIEEIPPDSWLRAYDFTHRANPTPLPLGVQPLNVRAGNLQVLGFASGRTNDSHDHYAFYVHPDGIPDGLAVTFETRAQPVEVRAAPEATMWRREGLANVPWFIFPLVGPPRKDVTGLRFGSSPDQRVPLGER